MLLRRPPGPLGVQDISEEWIITGDGSGSFQQNIRCATLLCAMHGNTSSFARRFIDFGGR